MRENRTYGSEGGEPSNGSLPYPYQTPATLHLPVKYDQPLFHLFTIPPSCRF